VISNEVEIEATMIPPLTDNESEVMVAGSVVITIGLDQTIGCVGGGIGAHVEESPDDTPP
jgi:hypothetical protein